MTSKRLIEKSDLSNRSEIDEYFSGEKLYGDNFSPEQIEAWFKDEEQGYFNLWTEEKDPYKYQYHALNQKHGFRFLPDRTYDRVLGVGSAFGEELLPIVDKSGHITILEPADGFIVKELKGVPVTYSKPQPSGILPFPSESFDLVTCLGVLHHIPNVSSVINEFHRCLKNDAYALLREPIVSMGDWRKPRKGLTMRERGIPLQIFRQIILSAGFEIISERKCTFSLTSRLRYFTKGPVYNSRIAVQIDNILCSLPIWPKRYHPVNSLQKIRPTSVFYVLRKST